MELWHRLNISQVETLIKPVWLFIVYSNIKMFASNQHGPHFHFVVDCMKTDQQLCVDMYN